MSDTVTWLAGEVFKAFPEEVYGLKFYSLSCRCIYYRPVREDGSLDLSLGIYRNPGYGACKDCISDPEGWTDRVEGETVVYQTRILIQPHS